MKPQGFASCFAAGPQCASCGVSRASWHKVPTTRDRSNPRGAAGPRRDCPSTPDATLRKRSPRFLRPSRRNICGACFLSLRFFGNVRSRRLAELELNYMHVQAFSSSSPDHSPKRHMACYILRRRILRELTFDETGIYYHWGLVWIYFGCRREKPVVQRRFTK